MSKVLELGQEKRPDRGDELEDVEPEYPFLETCVEVRDDDYFPSVMRQIAGRLVEAMEAGRIDME